MTQIFDDEGNITSVVGDTILFDISGVPTDLDYTIFFRVYDKDNNTIIPEAIIPANYNDTVTIEVKPYVTDMVIVPSGKKSVTYFYGIKACNFENQVEHTQTVDNVDLEQETKITFLRKRVEGFYYYGTLYPWISASDVTVYTNTLSPVVSSKIYTSTGFLTNDTVSSITTEDDEVTAIVVNGTTYSKPAEPGDDDDDSDSDSDTDDDTGTTYYAWIEGDVIYTLSATPEVGDDIYKYSELSGFYTDGVVAAVDGSSAIAYPLNFWWNRSSDDDVTIGDADNSDTDSDVDSDTDTD